MDQLCVYLPQDRRLALARGEPLPEHTHGAALFADIAGFTPLTEAFDCALGSRQGAEALTSQLYPIYDEASGYTPDIVSAMYDRHANQRVHYAPERTAVVPEMQGYQHRQPAVPWRLCIDSNDAR